MMMIVGLILYLLRARGGSPPRVLRGGGGRRAPICLGSRASLAPPPRLKIINLSSHERKNAHRRTPLESNRRARASPGFPTPERRSRPCRRGREGPRPRTASSPDSRTRATPEATSSWARPPRPRGARASRGRACSSGGTACRRRCTAWAWTRARVATAASLRGGFRGTREDAEGISSASVLETDDKHADARIGGGAEARGRSRPLPRARSRASLERETRPTLGVPQMKKAKGERRGTYRQRRSGRTVPPA